ncbi:MAG: Fe-S cluster assembly sulfur transfer protein SufU [Acidiferrobacter sp.]
MTPADDPSQAIYEAILKDHYRNPRNQGGLDLADGRQRGRNPRCGDDIEVGVFLAETIVTQVRFRARGCSVCVASASLMTEVVAGMSGTDIKRLAARLTQWMAGEEQPLPDALLALSVVRPTMARRRCVLLAWDALTGALSQWDGRPEAGASEDLPGGGVES